MIIDLFSRFTVGWALSAMNDRHLALRALEMAVRRRCPDEGLLHHSDQGSPYASEDYRKQLEVNGIMWSMSRRGNCYDNAAMESWFSTLKSELGDRFESYAEAKEKIFDYVEVFGWPSGSSPAGSGPTRAHDLRRTFITLAQVDGARRDLLETITHGPRGDIVSVCTPRSPGRRSARG